jgi:acyl carrier protein
MQPKIGVPMESFYAELAEILEVDAVKPTDDVRTFPNWDSLTVLSICAMVDSKYRVNLNGADLAGIKSAGELAEIVCQRNRR